MRLDDLSGRGIEDASLCQEEANHCWFTLSSYGEISEKEIQPELGCKSPQAASSRPQRVSFKAMVLWKDIT